MIVVGCYAAAMSEADQAARRTTDATRLKSACVTTFVAALHETDGKIEVGISSIQDLAHRTNVLVLNTLVGASCAGETGKGFAPGAQ